MNEVLTRLETLLLILKLDKGKTTKYKPQLLTLGEHIVDISNGMIEGDKLDLEYKFNIAYFDDCLDKINAIFSILADEDVIISVSLDELTHGECLIGELFSRIKELNRKIKERTTKCQSN